MTALEHGSMAALKHRSMAVWDETFPGRYGIG